MREVLAGTGKAKDCFACESDDEEEYRRTRYRLMFELFQWAGLGPEDEITAIHADDVHDLKTAVAVIANKWAVVTYTTGLGDITHLYKDTKPLAAIYLEFFDCDCASAGAYLAESGKHFHVPIPCDDHEDEEFMKIGRWQEGETLNGEIAQDSIPQE